MLNGRVFSSSLITSRPYCMYFIYSRNFRRPVLFLLFSGWMLYKMKNVQFVSFLQISCVCVCVWPLTVHPYPALCSKEYVLINTLVCFLFSCFTLYVSREDNLRNLLVACWFLCKVSFALFSNQFFLYLSVSNVHPVWLYKCYLTLDSLLTWK